MLLESSGFQGSLVAKMRLDLILECHAFDQT